MYLKLLERMRIAWSHVEKGLTWFFGSRNNPLFYHGALPMFAFWVAIVSGLLLFFYYTPTLAEAFHSIEYLTEGQKVPYGWAIRSLHRYSADAMVIAILLHAFRMYVTDRHRRWRHIPWISGAAALVVVGAIGISGYLLLWDDRSLLLTHITGSALAAIDAIPAVGRLGMGRFLERFFYGGDAISDLTLVRFLFFHIGLATLVFFLLWLHFIRITRPKIYPTAMLCVAILGALFLVSGLLPAEKGNPANPDAPLTAIQGLRIDWFYLWGYWLLTKWPLWLAGTSALILLLVLLSVPYWPYAAKERQPVNAAFVHEDKCVGCKLCAIDCPYQAIKMIRVPGGKGKRPKLIAVVYEQRCSECGICVGACDFDSIELPLFLDQQIEEQIATFAGRGL